VNAARAARVGGRGRGEAGGGNVEKYALETPWILENAAARRPSNL